MYLIIIVLEYYNIINKNFLKLSDFIQYLFIHIFYSIILIIFWNAFINY